MSYFRHFWVLLVLLLSFTNILSAKSEYKYSYVPKMVYENQVFPVTIVCLSECSDSMPKFTFDMLSETQPLNDEPLAIYNGDDSFYTFYFKASKIDITIPELFIESEGTEVTLGQKRITLGSLKTRDDYCGVMAADMKIVNYQVSNYDEKNHLVTMSIEAFEANLNDMYLNNVLEYGTEHLQRDAAKVMVEFYFVLPNTKKSIKFTYFNTIKKQYVYLETPIKLNDYAVTTQSDLNPKADSYELLKKYTFMLLVAFFILMFLFKRDFFYLVLGVVSLITLLTFYVPHEKICIKQGAPLYILPTDTSTVSTTIENKLDTLLLKKRTQYNKIEYKEGIIGWIKDEDICKN
ncbi:Putative periplasmic protein [hydrothermal vent metagenome]|uniref:Putative periplasmic protein n=1 Tax=hydrothermal vent metagenome TaxID=652676 RepID=A0A1W1EDI0_9ZZZZ